MKKTKYNCPICGFGMQHPAADYNICPSCGTEFGLHDSGVTFQTLREEWVQSGAQWHSTVESKPFGWNPYLQLLESGLIGVSTKTASAFYVIDAGTTIVPLVGTFEGPVAEVSISKGPAPTILDDPQPRYDRVVAYAR